MGEPRGDRGSGATPLGEQERGRWERALEAALRGPAVRRSSRSQQLLTYLVDETLAGRWHRITGVTIAQDVLGRDASFDSENDAIVRVQMRRLRVQLAQDQASAASGDAPQIVVPEGTCRPEFNDRPTGWAAARSAAPAAARPVESNVPALAEPARPFPSPAARRREAPRRSR